MFCKFCGNQIDDDAVFCSKCGKNLGGPAAPEQPKAPSAPTQRKLVVQRKKQFYGCGVRLGILLDGVEVARIQGGQDITLTISSEAHTMNIKQDNVGGKFQSKTYVVPAGAGDVYAYVAPTLFNDKWAITLQCM